MSRSIRIDGDVSALKRSILDLSKSLKKDLGKSKIELFSPETRKFLSKEAASQADNLRKKMEAIKQTIEDHSEAMKSVVSGSREELKLKEKILKASKAIADTAKEVAETEELANKNRKPTFMQGLAKGSGISKVKEMVSNHFDGMGVMGGLGSLAGTAGIAALAYGGSRVMAGRDTWKQGVADRISLQGRGETNLEPQRPEEMARAGLNAQTMRSRRMESMDIFGAEGATESKVVQRAGFERAHGIEGGTMAGIGAGLRPSLGGKGAEMTTMKLQAALISSGIKDALGPYLETAASMLTELNEKGYTQDDSVLALLNQMTKTGMGEGRIKNLAMGADQSIRGSSGESNAFYQSVFHGAGIGGKSIGGIQASMEMGGLFGADLDKYKGTISPESEKLNSSLGVGDKDYSQKVSSSLLQRLSESTGGQKGPQGQLTKLRFMKSMGLGKDIGQAEQTEGLLQKLANPEVSGKERTDIQKQLKNIQDENANPDLAELKRINESTAGMYDLLRNKKLTVEDKMGEQTADVFNSMNNYLLEIDQIISEVLGPIANLISGMSLSNMFSGGDDKNLSQSMIDQLKGGSGTGNYSNNYPSMKVPITPEEKKTEDFKDMLGALWQIEKNTKDGGSGVLAPENDKKALEIQQKQLDVMRGIHLNTKNPAGTPVGTPSTTGTGI